MVESSRVEIVPATSSARTTVVRTGSARPATEPGRPTVRCDLRPEPGEIVFGAYRIDSQVGSGGMGSVYRALHLELNEPRAIKILKPDQAIDERELLVRETQALRKVKHDAVVGCHELLSDRDGQRLGLVMEFVEGVPLSVILARGPLEAAAVLALGRRLAAGLDVAHAQGVVHRDLSPDNVVLPDERPDRAKLIDFGIAKDTKATRATIFEGFIGKLLYASPEQLASGSGAGSASDAYSLGLVLAAAALGNPLAMGATYEEAVANRRHRVRLPTSIPWWLRRRIEPLLVPEPERRPTSLSSHFAPHGQGLREAARSARSLRIASMMALSISLGPTPIPAAATTPVAVSRPSVAAAPDAPVYTTASAELIEFGADAKVVGRADVVDANADPAADYVEAPELELPTPEPEAAPRSRVSRAQVLLDLMREEALQQGGAGT